MFNNQYQPAYQSDYSILQGKTLTIRCSPSPNRFLLNNLIVNYLRLELDKGFEPSTLTLQGSCTTVVLIQHTKSLRQKPSLQPIAYEAIALPIELRRHILI